MRCPHRDHLQLELETVEALLLHLLEHQITLEEAMTEFANDQAHLDDDVRRLTAAFRAAVTELKAAIANNPDLPASQLDFAKLDSLVGTAEAEAAADAQPAPAVPGATVAAPTSNQAANTGTGNDALSAAGPTTASAPVDVTAAEDWPADAPAASAESTVTEAPGGAADQPPA